MATMSNAPLRLGCATMSYMYECSLEESLARIADLGFREVEFTAGPPHIWPRAFSAAERSSVLRAMERHGLRAITVNQRHYDVNIASANPGIREETLRQLKESIGFAADVGAPICIIVPGKPAPIFSPPPEEIWRLAREGIEECVEHGSKRGVICAVENVGFSLCPLGRDAMRLAAEVGSEYCKVHYDVANANVVESPADVIRELGPWLASVHLSDNDGRVWTHSPLGTGNIDFSAVFGVLREVGFSGTSILELGIHEGHDQAARDAIKRLTAIGWSI